MNTNVLTISLLAVSVLFSTINSVQGMDNDEDEGQGFPHHHFHVSESNEGGPDMGFWHGHDSLPEMDFGHGHNSLPDMVIDQEADLGHGYQSHD